MVVMTVWWWWWQCVGDDDDHSYDGYSDGDDVSNDDYSYNDNFNGDGSEEDKTVGDDDDICNYVNDCNQIHCPKLHWQYLVNKNGYMVILALAIRSGKLL